MSFIFNFSVSITVLTLIVNIKMFKNGFKWLNLPLVFVDFVLHMRCTVYVNNLCMYE